MFSNATENQNARNAQIDDKIENITMARDAAIEQEKKEKKAKSENLWKTGITTAATLAGSLIPGGGLIAPAIGSAVGNLVAGSGILDVTGDADPQMLMQGASDVFKSAANIQSTFTNKRTMQDIAEFMSGNMKRFDEAGNSLNLLALPKEQQELFKSALATGKWDTVYGLMGKPRPKMRMGDFINTDYWSE